jgi:cobalt-zinc-cadmium efflux system protein
MRHEHGHDHSVSGDHAHGHIHRSSAKALRFAFFINLAFTLVEVLGGWWTGSIAVLTDALHDAGDVLVLGAAWWLQSISTKDRDAEYSYGYGRYSMLGGWLTSVILIVGAVFMLAIAVPRLWEPVMPNATGMIGFAVFGLVMNGLAAWKLHGGTSLNERGAYLHLLEDVLGWAAVLLGSVVMYFTGWAVVDPLLSIGISVYILFNAIGTLRKGTGILMQRVPPQVDEQALRTRLLAIPGVIDLHDQHTWTLDGNYMVHSVHVVVATNDMRKAVGLKDRAREELMALGIEHSTIELELADDNRTPEFH